MSPSTAPVKTSPTDSDNSHSEAPKVAYAKDKPATDRVDSYTLSEKQTSTRLTLVVDPKDAKNASTVSTLTSRVNYRRLRFKVTDADVTSQQIIDKLINQEHDTSVTASTPIGDKRILDMSFWLSGNNGRERILYQQTPALHMGPFTIAPRVYMVKHVVGSVTDTTGEINWEVLDNWDSSIENFKQDDVWAQELSKKLESENLVQADSVVWTPYNNGSWKIDFSDSNDRWVEYAVVADAGGSLPKWLASNNAALMAYPNHFMNDVMGLKGTFETVEY